MERRRNILKRAPESLLIDGARACPPVGVALLNRAASTGHHPSPERGVSGIVSLATRVALLASAPPVANRSSN